MNHLRLLLFSIVVLFLSACGSAEPAVVVDAGWSKKPVKKTAVFDVFETVITQLHLSTDLENGETTAVGTGGEKVFHSFSPDGAFVSVAVSNAAESNLYMLDRSKRVVTKLFTGASKAVYSGAWNGDGSTFYYGQYLPDGKRMGTGSIHSFNTTTASNSRISCSASRFVLAALSSGSLLVRNSDSLYEVAVSDCATIKSIDARKMYLVSISPEGNRMAYILRDLVFNRQTRTYEPDSTLYVAMLGSSNASSEPVKIIGDKYQPRNMVWSPDGSELAYDVVAQDGSKKRAVSLYSIETAESSYLDSPTSTLQSNTNPMYSPGGQHIVFQSTSPSNELELKWRTSGQSFSQGIPLLADAPFISWDWVGSDLLFVKDKSGTSGLVDVSGSQGSIVWTGSKNVVFSIPAK